MTATDIKVGVVMGSPSDWETVRRTAGLLDDFGIGCEVKVLSAHRTPDEAAAYSRTAAERGLQVIIACAGMAAHLAGVMAAGTTLPVIAVPLPGGVADGLDALLASVQMPSGVPVATMAVGKAGAGNAAVLAAQILALQDPDLAQRVAEHKRNMTVRLREGQAMIDAEREAAK